MGAVLFSPITDVALTGESFNTRAEADLYFTKSQAAGLVRSYLGATDPKNPLASPLYADLSGLPPIRIHVGDDEVLLDDSRRYVERAVAAGVDAKLDVWMGMPHGFVTNVGEFNAASQALKASGAFLTERLGSTARNEDLDKNIRGARGAGHRRTYTQDYMKTPKPDRLGNSSTDSPGHSHEEIARRAYQFWEERGKPHGSDEEDWHRAERELRHQSDAPGDTPDATKETSE